MTKPVPEGFVVPEGWALVPIEPSWEAVKAAEDECDNYLYDRLARKPPYSSNFLKSQPPKFPLPAWPQENTDWPLPSRLIWNKILKEVRYKPSK